MRTLQHWITKGGAPAGATKPFYARKAFEVRGAVEKAEALVCGLGQFNFFLNGMKVGDHVLDPAWTDYRKVVRYVRFDVTDLLRAGQNVLGVEVGNGWFIKDDTHYTFRFPAFMPPNPNDYEPFAPCLMLDLKLTVRYTDGTTLTVEADDTFETCAHPVTASNVYGSEIIDGAKIEPSWCDCGATGAWEQARLVPEADLPRGIDNQIEETMPPIKVIKTYDGTLLHTVQVARTALGETGAVGTGSELGRAQRVYDFGQNTSFLLGLEVKGHKGDVIRVYPAEKLDAGGAVDQVAKGWCTVDTVLEYTLGKDGEWEDVSSTFTYLAGRYVGIEVESAHGTKAESENAGDQAGKNAGTNTGDQAGKNGAAPNAEPNIEIRNLKAHAITSAWKQAGTFTCDDERYNQILSMVERSVEANMMSVHTDCPTIERFAWQEENNLMAPAIMYLKDARALWQKFFCDLRSAQHDEKDTFRDFEGNRFSPGDGLVPSQAPCYIPNVLPVPGMGSFYDIIAWGSSAILGVYWHYQFYGDRAVIAENYEMGMRYLEHLLSKRTAEGFINHGLGDWGNPEGNFARENIETAFLYADTTSMQKFAEILGKTDDAARFERMAEEIRENYNNKLLVFDPENKRWCYRLWNAPNADGSSAGSATAPQTAGGIAMTQAVEALPLFWGMVPPEHEKDVAASLRATLLEKNAFCAGEVGLPYIIQCAARYGMNDLVCHFILKEEHPSYYAFVLDGETTLGEYWEHNPRSHCHDMMGHIAEWYFNGLAGIRATEPGFKSVCVKPYLPESMNTLSSAYQSASGTISVEMRRVTDGAGNAAVAGGADNADGETSKAIELAVRADEGITVTVDTGELTAQGYSVRLV